MNYFTPELVARGQVKDHDLLDQHEVEWDAVCDRYESHLQSILPEMPPGLKQIESSYYLHDAGVLSIGRRGDRFVLVLQLDTPPRSVLTLTYELVAEPIIRENVWPGGALFQWDPPLWLYNEIDRADDHWRELLLLSNGWEVILEFRDVEAEEYEAILPTLRANEVGAMAAEVTR